MRVRHLLPALLLLLGAPAGGPPAWAGAEADAADVTAPGRSLDKALDQALTAPGPDGKPPTAVLLVVDVTRSLREAGFGERLTQALQRQAKALQGVEVGLGRIGAKGVVTVRPGGDRVALLTDLNVALGAATANPVRNVYADLRAAAADFEGGEGRRLVLVSLDNGDVEDDLEGTVKALLRAHLRVHVIAREAWLADSYPWSHPAYVQAPKGTTLGAGDGAWPEIPWGWVLQQQNGHEQAPSGYAFYGLTRLAAATGGRVHLYAAPGGTHSCVALGTCAFCSQDHLPQHAGYQPHRVKPLAPSVGSREEVLAADARDPWLAAVLNVWEQAAKEGLIRSRPAVTSSGGGLKLEHRPGLIPSTLSTNSLSLGRLGKEAGRLREAGDRLLKAYEADLAKIGAEEGSMRHRATADTVRVMLQITTVNLALMEGWCQDAGPVLVGKVESAPEPPEVPRLAEGQRVVGWTYLTECLCHGLAPYRAQRLSAGPEVGPRMDALARTLQAFFSRYDHTPYGEAVRRSGLSTFLPTIQGKVLPLPPRHGGSTESEADTTPDRPGRGGGGSGESGPATTGK